MRRAAVLDLDDVPQASAPVAVPVAFGKCPRPLPSASVLACRVGKRPRLLLPRPLPSVNLYARFQRQAFSPVAVGKCPRLFPAASVRKKTPGAFPARLVCLAVGVAVLGRAACRMAAAGAGALVLAAGAGGIASRMCSRGFAPPVSLPLAAINAPWLFINAAPRDCAAVPPRPFLCLAASAAAALVSCLAVWRVFVRPVNVCKHRAFAACLCYGGAWFVPRPRVCMVAAMSAGGVSFRKPWNTKRRSAAWPQVRR